MNNLRFPTRILAIVVALCSITSCSLEQITRLSNLATLAQKPAGAPLQHGTMYEVRTALAPGVAFKPAHIKSYHFVMADAPRPPLIAAQRPRITANPARIATRPARSTTRSSLVAIRRTPSDPPTARKHVMGTHMTVRTTAYCHDESDHIVYGKLTALGTRLKFGAVRSAAADWSRYPVGTRFRIADQPGVIYQVDDYGSALVGTGTIDLYYPSRSAMNKWGVRHVDIEVLEWGSFEQSMSIMSERTRWPHVRRMINDIQNRVYEVTVDTVKTATKTTVL